MTGRDSKLKIIKDADDRRIKMMTVADEKRGKVGDVRGDGESLLQ